MQIRLSGYILESIVDGPGLRTVVFTQGCPHHCPGCHNPKTHPFDKGRLMEISDIVEILTSNPLSCGLTISGGEPFVQIDELLELIKQYKAIKPNHDIIIYTGFTYEYLVKLNNPIIDEIFNLSNLLIDGPYIEKLRDLTLEFRGSSNQRIIDLKKSTIDNIITL